jgi:hypothetical protein
MIAHSTVAGNRITIRLHADRIRFIGLPEKLLAAGEAGRYTVAQK